MEKNPNVAADLSGLLEGRVDLDAYFREQAIEKAIERDREKQLRKKEK